MREESDLSQTDSLYLGRAFRARNLIDEGDRQVLGIEVAYSIPSLAVIPVMEEKFLVTILQLAPALRARGLCDSIESWVFR
jgi:hypothetical protein